MIIIKKIFNKAFQIFFGFSFYTYKGALSNRSFDSMSSILFWMLSNLEKKYPNFNITDKKVAELGSGIFLSHPLGLKILGAKSIFTFDLYKQFIRKVASISFSQRVMSKKFYTSKIESSTYNNLIDEILQTNFDLNELKKIGINYKAPYDINDFEETNKFDLFISYTVMEHVPPNDILKLLKTSINILKPKGYFCHFIDLEDHKDPINKPFEFLANKEWSEKNCFNRGNRLRLNDWKNKFDNIDNISYEFIKLLERDKSALPSSIQKIRENYTSGILVVGQKKF